MMKTLRFANLGISIALFLSSTLVSNAAEAPLPTADVVLQRLIARAQSERPTAGVPSVYYLCTKRTVTEEMDREGKVKQRKVKVGKRRPHTAGHSDANKWSSQNGVNLNEELLRRYDFTMWKREMIDGRPALLLTFVPKDPPPSPRRLQDFLLNRTLGTVWIDEEESELVKAEIGLGQPVSFGILGAVDSFSFSFERARSPDGVWLTRWTDTTVKARKFLTPILTRKRVDWTEFKKLDGSPQ